MAAPVITCPDCRTDWHLVLHPTKAHPGNPNERGVFIFAGPSQDPIRLEAGTNVRYVWTCLCGVTLDHLEPGYEWVECTHGGQRCHVAIRRAGDPYRAHRAQSSGSCECCGLQGSHLVRKDRTTNLPLCLKGEEA